MCHSVPPSPLFRFRFRFRAAAAAAAANTNTNTADRRRLLPRYRSPCLPLPPQSTATYPSSSLLPAFLRPNDRLRSRRSHQIQRLLCGCRMRMEFHRAHVPTGQNPSLGILLELHRLSKEAHIARYCRRRTPPPGQNVQHY